MGRSCYYAPTLHRRRLLPPCPPTHLPACLCSAPTPSARPPACRHREALHSFQAAVRVQVADPLAHFRIGNTYFALKKYPEARKVRRRWGMGGCGGGDAGGW